MVYVQFEFSSRKRQLSIQGHVDSKKVQYIKLVQKICQRYYLDQLIEYFMNLFRYENQQLGSVLIVLISTVSTQILSHFLFNTQTQQGFSHITLSVILLYSFIVSFLVRKCYRLCVIAILEVLLGVVVTVVQVGHFEDYFIAVYLLGTNTACLLIVLLKWLFEEEMKDKLSSLFQLQSKFIIVLYLFGKVKQFYYPYISSQTINAYNLIPTIICITIINSLEIWHLFDFNQLYLIGMISSAQEMQTQEREHLQDIFELGDVLARQNKKKQQQQVCQNQYNPSNVVLSKEASAESRTYPSYSLQQESQMGFQGRSQVSQSQQEPNNMEPYSRCIWTAFLANFLLSATLILLIVFEQYDHSDLYLMSLGMFKALLIMLFCQHQSVMMSQKDKHKYSYLFQFITDILVASPFILVILFYDYLGHSTYYQKASILFHTSVPFITINIYRSVAQKINLIQSNQSVFHFFFVWVMLLSFRESLVIFMEDVFPTSYFVIDAVLAIYAILMMMVISPIQTYKWLFEQIKTLKKIKKSKLYVLESLRNWKYDITKLNQTLFFINLQIFLIGYTYLKSHQSQLGQYQVQYMIIFFSSLLIHLLSIYNNYFTQTWIQKRRKPCYSIYYNYVLLFLASGIYTLYSYLVCAYGSTCHVKHKTWSLLTLLLVTFIVMPNVLGNYVFEMFDHFRSSCKVFTLVASYFLFYYPFITVLTVTYFMADLKETFTFPYAVGGFAYLTVASITLGIFVHAILNLSQKSRRTLFLIKGISQQFTKINMKQDPEFVSMIQNLFDKMDGDSKKLLQQLNTQKLSKILTHDQFDSQYDYTICQPDKIQIENQLVKVIVNNDQNQPIRRSKARKTIKIHSIKNLSFQKIRTRQNFYKKQKSFQIEQNRRFSFRSSLDLGKSTIQNKNQVEINRLIQAVQSMNKEIGADIKIRKVIQSNNQFSLITGNEARTIQIMHRFFHFLSDPADSVSFDTFFLLNMVLINKKPKNLRQMFQRFSQNGQSLNQENFRDFLAEYITSAYQIKSSSRHEVWKEFIQNQLFIFLLKGNDLFRYYIRRKNIDYNSQMQSLWKYPKINQKQTKSSNHKDSTNTTEPKAFQTITRDKVTKYSDLRKILTKRNENLEDIDQNYQLEDVVQIESDQRQDTKNIVKKENVPVLTASEIYAMVVDALVDNLGKYEKTEHQNFKLKSIKCTLSNVIAILTKIFDFTYLYMYGSIYALYAYGTANFQNSKHILQFMNYHFVIGAALIGVIAYIGLILYHKKEFANGSLGMDGNQRMLSFGNLKYYTVFLLFLMGSSLSNLFIMSSLNSFICEQTSNTLFNFPKNNCYDLQHVVEMFIALIIMLSYYPLASLIFPFSAAIDRTLEIKYKSQYEIVYLQCKFLVNGIDVIFNQMDFQKQELIKSVTKTIICIMLAILFHKLQPCAVDFVNNVELKIYIGLVIINAASILCYFVNLQITLISFGVLLFLYVIYSFLSSIKAKQRLQTVVPYVEDSNILVNDKLEKQQTLKVKSEQKSQQQYQMESVSNLYKPRGMHMETDPQQNAQPIQMQIRNNQDVENVFAGQNALLHKTQKLKRKKNQQKQFTLSIKKDSSDRISLKRNFRLAIREDATQFVPAGKVVDKSYFSKITNQRIGQ